MTANQIQYTRHLLHELEDSLFDIASQWRTTQDDETVRHYHSVVNCMLDLGFTGNIDHDSCLPTRLMPERYMARWHNAVLSGD